MYSIHLLAMAWQVTVGHLETGDCIGEGMLRGSDRQPYTVISATGLRVGWVTSTTLRGEGKVKIPQFSLVVSFYLLLLYNNITVNEVEKHILSDKKFTLEPLTSVSSTLIMILTYSTKFII